MSVRSHLIFAVSLCLATTVVGEEPQLLQTSQKNSPAAEAKLGKLSALDHLRLATQELETAGMVEEAARLRDAADQINRRVTEERAELARQISELQQRSEQIQQLTVKPDKILCRCSFVELSTKAAAEFEAAAEPVNSSKVPGNLSICVYKNAEEALQRLKKSGQVTVLASPQIVTVSGREATVKSGAELPILLPAGGDQTSVEWRPFGMSCKVVPRLLDTGRIHLKFAPEIVERNFKNSVTMNGLTIPGLTSRMANTQAEMNLGETLVVSLVWNPGREDQDSAKNIVTLFMVTPVAID